MAGITSSLNTALSGLSTSQEQIGVVGNNIANVNTVGFKASSLDFKTQFLQNFTFGSAPNGNLGGTNPLQIGLGATSGAITKNFADGSLEATGVDTNLAIQGNGFFILRQGTQQVYTRDGSFQLNGENQLVSGTGQLVQGYAVDSNYNIIPGTLTNLTIPVGAASVAQATTKVNISGQLDANGSLPTTPAQLSTTYYLTNGAGGTAAAGPAGTDLLTNLTDSSGNLLYQNNDVIQLTATEGTAPSNAASATTRTITESFTVTSTSTLSDLTSFLQGALGINTSTTPAANGAIVPAPGVGLSTAGAVTTVNVVGNLGTGSDITLDQNSLIVKRAGNTINQTQNWTKTSNADGESVYTTTNVFDSLGNTLNLNVVASLVSKTSTGTTWQVYATSPDGTPTGASLNNVIGLGTLTFDGNGNLLSSSTPTVKIDRSNTGAIPNLQFAINFSGVQAQGPTNGVTQDNSALNATADGAIPGVLKTFSIGPDGMITGAFSNGLNRTVGQVALATFQNNEGLVDEGGNTYIAGPNSGNAIVTTPGSLSAGKITAGSLEGSNVDLSTEFVKLIAASTAFSASSRVITSSNQLLQDLLSAAR
ncbi:MAG TPA: flagellar hook-basal body complex protein [Phycisphaerae bacterium]|nr:flagellar hook-basal body complex protein [Phycisphaerae bacterium]